MEKIKRIFGEIDLSWKKLIIFAIIAGVYTAVMAMLPITQDTSFADISISFEVWILFGIFIIMNSKSAKDSALKCFVFFLISQPLVYLIQVPYSSLGWQIFVYYEYWAILTILTIPMGFIGYYMKKDKWWGLVILTPILILLGYHYFIFLGKIIYNFPYHLLSTLFCIISMMLYPVIIFNDKKIRITGVVISTLIILATSIIILLNNNTSYNTTVLINGGSNGAVFDNTYNVYLEDESFGRVYIVYNEALEEYMVNAEFKKAGKTNIILEDSSGNKTIFEIDIKNHDYDINKK